MKMPTCAYVGLVYYLQSVKHHVNLCLYKGNEVQEKDTKELSEGFGKQ